MSTPFDTGIDHKFERYDSYLLVTAPSGKVLLDIVAPPEHTEGIILMAARQAFMLGECSGRAARLAEIQQALGIQPHREV